MRHVSTTTALALLFASASVSALAQAPAAPPAAPAPAGYSGHGAESVPPDVIAKFAPPALPPALAAKIQMLADVRAPLGGALSPDGKKLYFVWTVTGVPEVWRLDGPNTFPVQMTGGEDRTAVAGITPDGKTLVLGRDRKGEENPGLYTMPASGGPLTTIQHIPGVQTGFELISEDGKWLYFRSNDVKRDSYRILRVELATGKKETVFEEPGLWGVADYRDDGRLLLRKATGSQTAEYWEWDPVKKTKTPLLGQGEKDELRASYGKKEGELIVVTAKFGDFRRAYRWEKGQFEPITPELSWNVERAHVDRSKTRLFYSVNEGGYHKPHLLDPTTFKELPLPKLPPADSIGVGGSTRDGRFTTFTVSTARAPAESWVHDWKTGALTRWLVPSTPEVDTSTWSVAALDSRSPDIDQLEAVRFSRQAWDATARWRRSRVPGK